MKNFLTFVLIFSSTLLVGQEWVEYLNDTSKSFYEIQESFYDEWDGDPYERGKGWKQFKRWEWYMEPRVYPNGNRINTQSAYAERMEFEAQYGVPQTKSTGWTPLGPDDWQSISYNPGIGRINVIAQHPTNDQIIYAGSPSGGIWKTTNGGSTWENLNDDFPTLGVSGIAIDNSDPQVIYISTGDKDGSDTYSIGVVKSNDGGATWTNTGLSHSLSDFVVCRELKISPFDNSTLIVATNQGVFRTTDGGDNWTQSQNGNFRDIEFHPSNPSIVYASDDRLWKSDDGGLTFNQISSGLPQGGIVNRMELAVSPDEPNWVYALTGKESDASYLGLYRSTDSGENFQLQSDSPNVFGYESDGSDESGQSWYDMAIDSDPNDASTVVVGGINVWKSTNAGQSWTIVSHWIYPSSIGYTHADIHEIRFFNGTLYCGSDGGIFRSDDGGGNWSDLTPGMDISQFYRLGISQQDPNLVVGGTQDNGSNLLDNGFWTHVMGADGMEADINPTNNDIMFVTQQYGGLFRTSDGGNSWDFIFNGDGEEGGWVTPYESVGTSTVIAGYQNVWKSVDHGNSFFPISSFGSSNPIRDLDVADTDEDIIYVALTNSLRKTTDGGSTWEIASGNLPNLAITDINIHPTNEEIVFVTTSGYEEGKKVYLTLDGGINWQNISQNLPNIPANSVVYQEGSNGGIYVGMDVGVYYTDSSLSNWQAFDLDLPNVIVNELEIQYGAGKICAATYGRGIWESDLYSPSILPPTADFTQSSTDICEDDSITFTDASINASPGWTWYFPGGFPEISTSSSPSVYYPSSGSYEVSLVMQNPNGTDSIAKTIEVTKGEFLLDLTIRTDNNPGETSWELLDENGNVLFARDDYLNSNTIYNQEICLSESCYTFIVYDDGGDGLCCQSGVGYYKLTDNDGFLIQGGNFDESESNDFCLGDASLSNSVLPDIRVFPNPVKDYLTIDPGSNDTYLLEFIDATGRIVKRIQSVQGVQQITVADLSSGIYTIKISMNGNAVSKRFTKE